MISGGVMVRRLGQVEWGYVGLVLGQPCLQDLTSTFEGRTVR